MDQIREKKAIERKLARCRQLAEQYVSGPTAEHIRELETELLDDLRALDRPAAKRQ